MATDDSGEHRRPRGGVQESDDGAAADGGVPAVDMQTVGGAISAPHRGADAGLVIAKQISGIIQRCARQHEHFPFARIHQEGGCCWSRGGCGGGAVVVVRVSASGGMSGGRRRRRRSCRRAATLLLRYGSSSKGYSRTGGCWSNTHSPLFPAITCRSRPSARCREGLDEVAVVARGREAQAGDGGDGAAAGARAQP